MRFYKFRTIFGSVGNFWKVSQSFTAENENWEEVIFITIIMFKSWKILNEIRFRTGNVQLVEILFSICGVFQIET